jgi:20S proteasome subunit beta 2
LFDVGIDDDDPEDSIDSFGLEEYFRLKRDRWLYLPVTNEDMRSWQTTLQGTEEVTEKGSSTDLSSRFLSTGTTIVGIALGDTCILAADTRATAGTLVANLRADKLHRLGKFAAAAGAGTSADLDHLTRECRYTARLQSRLSQVGNADCEMAAMSDDEKRGGQRGNGHDDDGDFSSVLSMVHFLQNRLYEQGGSCQANLIVGGVDPVSGRAHLRAIHPHGSVDVVTYTALGSGGMAAMAVLESRYTALEKTVLLTEEDALALAVEAVRAGIVHDLGSGSQVDAVIISARNGCQFRRCIVPEESLPPTRHTNTSNNVITSKNENMNLGVNGFGNTPFSVRSTRVVKVSQQKSVANEMENWKDVLHPTIP